MSVSGRQTYKDSEITIFHIDNPPYKVIVLGDAEVGKTSLVRTHTKARFDSAYHTTVGVNIAKETMKNINGKDVGLLIWDIAGQSQFYLLHRAYFQGASGIIYVFDLTRSSTLSNVKNVWYKQVTDYGVANVPAILVGNKTDLKGSTQVIKPAALGMAKTLGEIPYIETSAKTGESVDEIFIKLCDLMVAAYE